MGQDYLYYDTDYDALQFRTKALQTGVDGVTFAEYTYRGDTLRFDYLKPANTEATVELPLYAYPGYRAYLNGDTELEVSETDNHLLTVLLPAETSEGSVLARYEQPWYDRLGDGLTLAALCWLVADALWRRRKPSIHAKGGIE